MTTLTARQTEVLDTIKQSIADKGYPPTVREIGVALGINSPNGVMCHLDVLEKKGVIERDRHQSRCIRVTDGTCPICGREVTNGR